MSLEQLFEQTPTERAKGPDSLSDDDVIAEYIKLDRRVKEAASDRSWYASALAQKASEERQGPQKTVHLENSKRDQKVKVEFGTEWKVLDEGQMPTIRELLGNQRFDELFAIKYVPRVRELKAFLNTGSSDERVKTAKAIVLDAVKEVDKLTPTLSVEKS